LLFRGELLGQSKTVANRPLIASEKRRPVGGKDR
jgi:hypothetical protein